jgi:hypothetical protein
MRFVGVVEWGVGGVFALAYSPFIPSSSSTRLVRLHTILVRDSKRMAYRSERHSVPEGSRWAYGTHGIDSINEMMSSRL